MGWRGCDAGLRSVGSGTRVGREHQFLGAQQLFILHSFPLCSRFELSENQFDACKICKTLNIILLKRKGSEMTISRENVLIHNVVKKIWQGKSLAWLGLGREGCGGTKAGDVRRRQPRSFVHQVECLVQRETVEGVTH